MGLFGSIGRWLGLSRSPLPPPPEPEPAAPPPPSAGVPSAETPDFPFPLVSVHGRDALATWQRLRDAGKGWPVVIGTDEDVAYLRDGIAEIDGRSPEAILAAAAALSFPAALAARREADDREARAWLRENGHGEVEGEPHVPPVGDWPVRVAPVGFTAATDVLTGRHHERVHVALLPCDQGWEAIAHLRWGNWNENPAAEYHVAALKSWHEAYGAELVACTHDVLNLHVATRPFTRDAALRLARDQYLYCTDIVDQGTETLAGLAAALMADDWWYFWWD